MAQIFAGTRRAKLCRYASVLLLSMIVSTRALAAVDVDRVSSPILYIDTGDDFFGMYAGYQISNNSGADIVDLWVGTENFSGTIIGTGDSEDGFVSLGRLATGQSATAFIYLKATAITAAETHDVSVYDGVPSTLGGTGVQLLASPVTSGGSGDGSGTQNGNFVQYSLDASETIGASANKVETTVVAPNPPELGGELNITITGSTGQIGAAGIFAGTPAVLADWPADSLQLVTTSIEMTGANAMTITDGLYVVLPSSKDTPYTSTYTFIVTGPTAAPSSVMPVNYISSGNALKHTGGLTPATFPPIQPVVSKVSLAHAVSPGVLSSGGGTASYTVIMSNDGGVAVDLRELLDVMPSPATGSVTYVAASAKIDGVAFDDAKLTLTGQQLSWAGPFTVPVGGTVEFTYDLSYSGTPDGGYDNSAIAYVALTQIDSTTDAYDDAPATATLAVGVLPVDTDGDGVLDSADLDDDNDGIPDSVESSGDSDLDGVDDSLDIDSDNDGIPDNVEAQVEGVYTPPAYADTDNDGLDNAYDSDNGGSAIIIANSDGLDQPDYLDDDSDNDGVPDLIEAHDANADGEADIQPAAANADADGDGLNDNFDTISGPAGTNATGSNAALPNRDTLDNRDWRDSDDDNDGTLTSAEDTNTNADFADDDTDTDGTPDYLESSSADTDGDGVVDQSDPADTDSCIPSQFASGCTTDTDGDGTADSDEGQATDSDNDGTPDYQESSSVDSDGDGVNNQADPENNDACVPSQFGSGCTTDTDSDGSPDSVEGQTSDSDSDGTADYLESSVTDTDGDGVADESDPDNTDACIPSQFGTGCTADTDSDGTADSVEGQSADSDSDGTPDYLESSVTDTDGDGVNDQTDTDNTNSCIPSMFATGCSADSDGDGVSDSAEGEVADTDGDGTADYLESAQIDTDGDGVNDQSDPDNTDSCIPSTFAAGCSADTDADGIPDGVEGELTDTDSDGTADYLDLDSDGDGILDIIEDDGGFGLLDSDGDGTVNYIDLDSDNDGIPDVNEDTNSPLLVGNDADTDGIDDALDVDLTNGNDVNTNGVDDAFEPTDTDGDGTPDHLDIDSDADGIADILESTSDSDGDGIADYLDTDSDNDGILDAVEGSNSPALLGTDADNDGIDDALDVDLTAGSDVNTNGIDDAFEPVDTDGDGTPDHRDIDSDGDGIADILESTSDTDGDGIADYLDTDSDNDGIMDAVEGSNSPALQGTDADNDGIDDALDVDLTAGNDVNTNGIDDAFEPTDTDGDGTPDHRDIDSDGDGIADILESTSDIDGDGIADYLDTDSDNDGILDAVEDSNSPALLGTDADNDGIDDALDADLTRGTDANANGVDDAFEPVDSDADGVPDYQDEDSDNDGLPDASETDGSGSPIDSDLDGTPDHIDTDSDNDGISDVDEGTGDIDGDGISNYLDLDSDGDGISDAIEGSEDTDGDGLPDSLDVDSDGDGTSDAEEGFTDFDGDGIVDALDTDSDNDGISDLVEGSNDSDGDGVSDSLDIDADNDGILDEMEVGRDPTQPLDTDSDGVPDYLDLDSDNDGLTDAFEAGGMDVNGDGEIDNFMDRNGDGLDDGVALAPLPVEDFDTDGIADYRDRDSDNDGLSDLLETTGTALDVDGNGEVDDFIDVNGDGLDDAVALAPTLVSDIDDDGQSNHLDLDTDGDGILDLVEAGGQDANGDGIVDSMADSDKDGIPDLVDVDVTGGVDSDNDGIDDSADASFVVENDTDGDGIVDSRDPDADGDGFANFLLSDGSEPLLGAGLPDIDGNGIPDVSEANASGEWQTGISGSGCSISPVSNQSRFMDPMLPLLAIVAAGWLWLRRGGSKKRWVVLMVASLFTTACSSVSQRSAPESETVQTEAIVTDNFSDNHDDNLRRHVYAGFGLGVSRLEPESRNMTDASVDDSKETSRQLTLGVDINKWIAAELHSADLGSAGLSTGGRISYKLHGASALFYAGKNRHRWRRQGITGYGRLGLGWLNNSGVGTVTYEQEKATHVLFGLGLEYALRQGLGLRAEFITIAQDVSYAQLGIIYRTGRHNERRVPEPVIENHADPVPDVVIETNTLQVSDDDHDGVVNESDNCPATSAGVAVDIEGCAYFEAVLEGVIFNPDSDQLTAESEILLQGVIESLNALPDIAVRISAHTDNQGSVNYNQQLSENRARSVRHYLSQGGIEESRMTVQAYGETQPVASNETAEGRRSNRRVEISEISR